MVNLYQVFTRGDLQLVIPDSECTFDTLHNIETAGFILRWDSAPTLFKGAQYAAEHYQAFLPVERKEFVAENPHHRRLGLKPGLVP